MSQGFLNGHFNKYSKESLLESRKDFSSQLVHDSMKVSVFISHKHDDLPELKGLIGFLEKEYNCLCYIDSDDNNMPFVTNGETATRIKNKIINSKKFILLATPGAIQSKWCNWELGFGDAKKLSSNNIALIFINSTDSYGYGNEYMQNYPYIVYRTSNDKYSNGKPIEEGYYLKYKKDGEWYLTKLLDWINK